jgi:TPR repeat protein
VPAADSTNRRFGHETLRQVSEIMDTYPDLNSTQFTCPSAIVPAKAVDSQFRQGKCSDDPLKCLEECRADNNGPSCYALANLMDNTTGVSDTYSAWLYYKACGTGIVSGCTNHAAGMLELNPDDEQVKKCSTETFEKTCALEDPWGCTAYSFALTEGIGHEVDLDAALAVADKACKNGEIDPACRQAKSLVELIRRKQKLPASAP